jgi:predicted HTH transcriptional regulator
VILNDTQGNTQNGTQGVTQDELDNWIVEHIRKNHNITTEELAKLSKKGIRTIKRHISKLPNIDILVVAIAVTEKLMANSNEDVIRLCI